MRTADEFGMLTDLLGAMDSKKIPECGDRGYDVGGVVHTSSSLLVAALHRWRKTRAHV